MRSVIIAENFVIHYFSMTTNSLKKKQNLRILIIVLVIILLLLIPLIAMQFKMGFQWTLSDFITAGILLISGGTGFELIMRKAKTAKTRLILILLFFLLLFLVWAELAVGVF